MKWKKAIVCAILAAAVLTSSAGAFEDTQGHWAQPAVERWAGHEVISGYSESSFGPDDNMTRGQMAALLSKLFGWTLQAENPFADLPDGAWYTADVLKANAAGVLQGGVTADGRLMARPGDPITREEAAVMLARALHVSGGEGKTFRDSQDISGWARGSVDAMSSRSYINGLPSGDFAPKALITRAETVTVLDNAVAAYCDKAGSYFSRPAPGIVIVRGVGVTLRDMEIEGGLMIVPGAAGGEVVLQNVTVTGTVIIQTGGDTEILVSGASRLEAIQVEGDGARLSFTDTSAAGKITVSGSGAELRGLAADMEVAVERGAENVRINGHAAPENSRVTAGKDISADKPAAVIGGGAGVVPGPGPGGGDVTPDPEPTGSSWVDDDGVIHIDFGDLLG